MRSGALWEADQADSELDSRSEQGRDEVGALHHNVARTPLYCRSGDGQMFAWLHQPTNRPSAGFAALICNPLGQEYMSGYRSIRHLADELADAGISTMRFDYTHTGNSMGEGIEHSTVEQFMVDITSAATSLRSLTGESRIVILGVGFGATFAALAAERVSAFSLVMWNPTTSGKRFVREQRLLSGMLGDESPNNGAIDSAGVYLTPELQADIGKINLTHQSYAMLESVLIVSRNDMDQDAALASTLEAQEVPYERLCLPGYQEMMDHPTETHVPHLAIDRIRTWLAASVIKSSEASRQESISIAAVRNGASPSTAMNMPGGLTERACNFGLSEHLFGIVTEPALNSTELAGSPAYVFLNCGSEHHVGPHRIYTVMARNIASKGHLAFRFDIEGIGDAISRGGNPENNSYSPVATKDLREALAFLQARYGVRRFVLSGICAGAYHSYKGSVEISDFDIVETNLINPLVFEWNYDDPEDHFRYYKPTNVRLLSRLSGWVRIVSGEVDYRYHLRSIKTRISEKLVSLTAKVRGAGRDGVGLRLPNGLRALARRNTRLNLILAGSDPGYKIMLIQAKNETLAASRDGWLRTHIIEHADHSFSLRRMQDELHAKILDIRTG